MIKVPHKKVKNNTAFIKNTVHLLLLSGRLFFFFYLIVNDKYFVPLTSFYKPEALAENPYGELVHRPWGVTGQVMGAYWAGNA